MNIFWKINRWYDDLAKTNPVSRFLYFLGLVMSILLIPSVSLIVTGQDYPAATGLMWILLLVLGIIRIAWLRKNGAL